MRAHTAIFLAFVACLACANRGMHAPDDGGPGAAGSAGTAGRGGSGAAGRGGAGGGGATGTGGTGRSDHRDRRHLQRRRRGRRAGGGACGAMFNFETDNEGATINAGSTAFTAIMRSTATSYCGSGALAITALFSGTSGTTTKGEVLIPLPGAPVDLTGKTITVHVAADPGCSADLNLSVVLNTQSGPVYFTPAFPIRPVTNTWKTGTATVTAAPGSTVRSACRRSRPPAIRARSTSTRSTSADARSRSVARLRRAELIAGGSEGVGWGPHPSPPD